MSFSKLASGFLLKTMGWKVEGSLPESKRNVVIGAPHTSMHDFKFAVLAAMYLQIKVRILVKKELFWFPLGAVLRLLGAIPVERKSNSNMVDRIADLINRSEEFYLAMSPEGTRRSVDRWRSGFYYIALAAKVPIIVVAIDYGRKIVKLNDAIQPTGDFDADFVKIMACFEGVLAKHPEKFRLLENNDAKNS